MFNDLGGFRLVMGIPNKWLFFDGKIPIYKSGWWFGTLRSHFGSRSRLKTCQIRGRPTLANFERFRGAMGSNDWDNAVAHHTMFAPNWSKLSKGDHVSVVLNGLVYTDEVVVGHSLPDNRPVRLYGEIQAGVKGCKCLTVLGALFDCRPPFVDLLLTDESMVLAHGLKPAEGIFQTVEFCAGLGATGVGLLSAGFELACGVEWRAPMASVFETVHPTVPVVVGDIAELSCLKQVAALVDPPFCLAAGISCQPYSVGGAQGGSSDERSNTLPSTIRACYLFQCPLLILECVPPVRTNRYARSLLMALEKELGYH